MFLYLEPSALPCPFLPKTFPDHENSGLILDFVLQHVIQCQTVMIDWHTVTIQNFSFPVIDMTSHDLLFTCSVGKQSEGGL